MVVIFGVLCNINSIYIHTYTCTRIRLFIIDMHTDLFIFFFLGHPPYLGMQRHGGLDDAVAGLLHAQAEALQVPPQDGAVDALEVAPVFRDNVVVCGLGGGGWGDDD